MQPYGTAFQIAVLVMSYFALCAECFHYRAGTLNRAPELSRSRRTLSPVRYQKHQAYDDNRMYVPPKYVMDAVKNRKDRPLTVADVSAATGVGLTTVQNDLMQLAHASGGRLQVTKQGQIIYVFPSNFEFTIIRNSLARRMQLIFEKLASTLGFMFRASFGLCLVASLAVITTALFVAMSSKSASSNDKRDDKKQRQRAPHNRSYGGPSFVTYIDVTDVLRVVLRYAQWPGSSDRNNGDKIFNHNLGFLESFFSFVFGDGNPNEDFEERASAQAAQMIRQEKGLVSAEQLAPYLRNPPPLPRSTATVPVTAAELDESYVLPLLLRFNGQPGVTTNGDIFYVFPELLLSGQQAQQQRHKVEPLLEEDIPFSRAGPDVQFLAGTLAGVNLLGAVVLGQALHSCPLWARKIYPLLVAYAVMFTAVPLFRYVTDRTKNNGIRTRNDCRLKWLQLVKKDPDCLEKLQEISQLRNLTSINEIGKEKSIVFDTTSSEPV